MAVRLARGPNAPGLKANTPGPVKNIDRGQGLSLPTLAPGNQLEHGLRLSYDHSPYGPGGPLFALEPRFLGVKFNSCGTHL